MNKIDYTIDDDYSTTVTLRFNVEQLKPLQPKSVVDTIFTILKNFGNEKFIRLDNQTQQYLQSIYGVQPNNSNFNRLLDVYVAGMLNYQYTHLDVSLYNKFELINALEPTLQDFELPEIKQVKYRLNDNVLYIDKIEQLTAMYGKSVVLYLAQILIQNLKHQYKMRHGVDATYEFSNDIKRATFNSVTNQSDWFKQFVNERYFINLLFASGCLQFGDDVNTILEMILFQQHVISKT